jgi:hypothetical protein
MNPETPLLFGKWKPTSFDDVSLQGSTIKPNINIVYRFSLGEVYFTLNDDQCHLQAYFPTKWSDLAPRYDPSLKQMYLDGKEYTEIVVKDFLGAQNTDFKRADIDKISWFGRMVHMKIDVDFEKLGMNISDVDARDTVLRRVYDDIEARLRTGYGFSDVDIKTGCVCNTPTGKSKMLSTKTGLHVMALKFGSDVHNAGSLYLKIIGDENAQQEEHQATLDAVLATFEDHKSMLCTSRGLPFYANLRDNGTFWQIDLQRIPLPKKLTSMNVAMLPHCTIL